MARQADSPKSFEFPIRANHPIRANRANRFARITPLRGGEVGGFRGPRIPLNACGCATAVEDTVEEYELPALAVHNKREEAASQDLGQKVP